MKQIYFLAGILFLLIINLMFSLQPATQVNASENVGIGSTTPINDPFIIITNPQNGAQVSGVVSVETEASSSAGVQIVDFWLDSAPIASDSAYPFAVSWDTTSLPAGSWHTLTAIVYDFAGKSASSYATVQITPAPTPTPTPTPIPMPTVSITSPVNGGTVSKGTTTTITAQASDSQGISKVEFYVNNSLTCTDTASSYACNWKVPARNKVSYMLTAKAYNLAGNTTSSSIRVTSR